MQAIQILTMFREFKPIGHCSSKAEEVGEHTIVGIETSYYVRIHYL